jgi:hypothetical protein
MSDATFIFSPLRTFLLPPFQSFWQEKIRKQVWSMWQMSQNYMSLSCVYVVIGEKRGCGSKNKLFVAVNRRNKRTQTLWEMI